MPFREAGGTITNRKTGKKGLPPKDKSNRMTISHQEIDASKLLDISEISKRSQILPKTARRQAYADNSAIFTKSIEEDVKHHMNPFATKPYSPKAAIVSRTTVKKAKKKSSTKKVPSVRYQQTPNSYRSNNNQAINFATNESNYSYGKSAISNNGMCQSSSRADSSSR